MTGAVSTTAHACQASTGETAGERRGRVSGQGECWRWHMRCDCSIGEAVVGMLSPGLPSCSHRGQHAALSNIHTAAASCLCGDDDTATGPHLSSFLLQA
jgi:hypothetical protein